MRGTLVIALCVTGCFSDRGVAIEVDIGDTGATSVELFIGKDGCTSESHPAGVTCGGITPPNVSTELTGDIWFRDDLLPLTVDVKGHKATFQLKTDEAITLPIVIAVGSKAGDQGTRVVGTATLREVVIPANDARIVTTTLAAENPVIAKPSSAEVEDRFVVWGEKTLPTTCVAVEHWENGQVKRDFVVPENNPDCDDVARIPECNANAYHGMNAGGQALKPDCFAPGTRACVLGSRACTDDAGPMTGTCAAQQNQSPVCVPSQFCGCDAIDGGCTLDRIVTPGELPRVECFVPARGLLPTIDLCPGDNSGRIDLNGFFPANSQCGEQPLLGSLQLAGYGTSLNVSGAVMELSSPEGACSFSITWKSGTHTGIDAMDGHGVIKLQTSSATLLLPIVFHFTTGTCAVPGQFHCSMPGSATDSLWNCAKP